MLSTPKAKAELFLASSLYDGLEDNNIVQVTTLLLNKEADPNVLIPSQGITPFHLVIGNDSETFAEEVTKLFLRHGGNPNVKSVDGMTPVHVAAAWGRLGVLELLLSNGGDPLLVDDDGRCPFHYAFDEAHYDAVATLGKYCGESFEEDSDPKYNIVLDKILVSNGGIVAEYAVSEDSYKTAASNVPAISTSKISNNNDHLLKNMNQYFGNAVKAENHASERQAKYPANIDVTITTTADESSISLPKFVNVRRHRRCLPQKNSKHVERKLENEDKFDRADRVSPQENLPARDNRPSISHLNDPIIEASFLVQPQKVGENMPRVSSPKSNEKLIKSEHGAKTEYRNTKPSQTTPRDNKKTTGASKFVHKTPLRSSKRGPLVELKKTPTSVSANKVSNFKGKITPNNGKFSSNDRAPIRTPNRYISKQISYSPDCSIVSKSPNLIRTPVTPTNNHRFQEERTNIRTGSAGTPSKNLTRIPKYGTSCKTPTPDKVFNNGNSGKNFSRFVKQSDLRHQGTKKTPISSPGRFRESPTWSKKCTRTPNLTDSTKRKKKCSTGKTKTALTPSYSTTRLPTTPLNKTYSKNEYFDAAGLSPDVETANRFVGRRTFARNIAIKLEETMYDDDCDKRITSTDVENMKNGTRTTMNSGSSVALERDISNAADNRLGNFDGRISTNKYLASNKHVQISGVNTIADSTKVSEGELSNVHSIHSHNDARGSTIIAGFFQPHVFDGSSIRTSDGYGTMNNAIPPGTSRPCSIILASNFPVTEHPTAGLTNRQVSKTERCDDAMASAACSKRPNSKEIDDSLVSSECSSYALDNPTRDPTGSMNIGDIGLSIEQGEYSKNGAARGINTSKSEVPLPPSTEENCPADGVRTRSVFPDVSSSVDSSSYASFVSVEEEYKYEDPEEGVILLERRLLITPVSIPMVKSEDGVSSPSEKNSESLNDESMASCVSSLPHSLVVMDSETLRRELTKLDCHPPGPITATTRHVYLRRLRKLQKHGPAPKSSTTPIPPKFSPEIERTLRSDNWMNDLSAHETLEQQVFKEFANPDPTRRWREGTTKSSFNYLLMDPRITDNLPRRSDSLSPMERWQTFLSSIFYVGKGRRSRPYAHLYEAYGKWKAGTRDTGSKKVDCILDIWTSNCGVVCLHFFQNTIPVEAYTREAAMIEALGLDRLKNCKSGEYYGVAATWSHQQKRTLGIYLLYKAMHILINEGERQLSPDDIGR